FRALNPCTVAADVSPHEAIPHQRHENSGNCACFPLSWGRGPGCTAIELRRNGFFPILIVILLLISKNLSRARLRLGLRLRACQSGPAAGLNSMAVGLGRGAPSIELARLIGIPSPLPSPHSSVVGRGN